MFISLLIIPFCKAADAPESWNKAIKNIPNIHLAIQICLNHKRIEAMPESLDDFSLLTDLDLNNNLITAIPGNLYHFKLYSLCLQSNQIEYVDPQILDQFPELLYLDLNKNPLSQENVNELKEAIEKRIGFILRAEDIGEKYKSASQNIKKAKR